MLGPSSKVSDIEHEKLLFSENKQQQIPCTFSIGIEQSLFCMHLISFFTLHLTLPGLTGEKSSMQAFFASLGLIALL